MTFEIGLLLGINREGRNILRKLSRFVLRAGDVLLVQGRKANLAALEDERAFSILNAVEERRVDRKRASLAAAIFAGAVLLAASNRIPVSVAMLLGAFATFLTRCITPSDAYREVDWLVYGPGRYRFSDFFKVGAPLTLLLFETVMLLVPWLWPVKPEG